MFPHHPHIRVSTQEAERLSLFLVKKTNWTLNTPSPPCSNIRESFPSVLKAKQTTVCGPSMRPLRVAVSASGSDVSDTLKPRGETVPFTLQETAGLGLESTEQRHSTSRSSTTQAEESRRMAGLSV